MITKKQQAKTRQFKGVSFVVLVVGEKCTTQYTKR